MSRFAVAAGANAGSRRGIPSVEKVLVALGQTELPRPLVLAEVRRVLGAIRQQGGANGLDDVLPLVETALEALARQRLQPVINATGIVLHTNLGRAPLSDRAIAAVQAIAGGYSNLEFDLATGGRGGRAAYLDRALAVLCGSEAAAVVNNCAAALVLVLHGLAKEGRREVIVSRGELVQIGGGFRLPEILEASGATLREVGTTNQTSIEDYSAAVGTQTALLLKVHHSNFYMEGFVAAPASSELAELAQSRSVPFVEDLGSGAIGPSGSLVAPAHEPTPAEVLRSGADLVTFSGDKLLGGPQAGILAGKAELVAKLKKDPLFRALRCDKMTCAALEATVDAYLGDLAKAELPVAVMLQYSEPQLLARAEAIRARLPADRVQAEVVITTGQVGGGCLPRSEVPSVAVQVRVGGVAANELQDRLARQNPPVIATVSQNAVRLNLRTVFPRQDDALLSAILQSVASNPDSSAKEKSARGD